MATSPNNRWRWPLLTLACLAASTVLQTQQLTAANPATPAARIWPVVALGWAFVGLLTAVVAGLARARPAGPGLWLAVPAAVTAASASVGLVPAGWRPATGSICLVGGTLALSWLLRRPWTRWVAAAGWLILLVQDAPGPAMSPAEQAAGAGPDLVLVTLDTVRADHISTVGGFWSDPITPALDALATRGAFFTNARTPVPLTLPAHAAMLTGRSPEELGLLANGGALEPGAGTITEALHARGYATGAFVSATVLDRSAGLAHDFDHYDDVSHTLSALLGRLHPRPLLDAWRGARAPTRRDGAETIRRALAWRSAQLRPTFTWIHLYDAHGPYRPPAELTEVVAEPAPGAAGSAAWQQQWRAWRTEHLGQTPRLARRASWARDYAACVAQVDALVGELVAALPEDTALVIASDHGEALGEHGYAYNHGRMLHEPALRVPVWVLGPGIFPERIDEPVRLERVADTLRHLAGLPAQAPLTHAARADVRTEALTPGQETVPELGLGPLAPVVSTLEGPHKRWAMGDKVLAFDLDADPEERSPLEVAPLASEEERLQRMDDRQVPTRRQLEALGYVE